VQVLLVPGRPLRCHSDSPSVSRRDLWWGFPRTHAAHPGISKAYGLALHWVSAYGNDFNRD
jgi:hypothetical protein